MTATREEALEQGWLEPAPTFFGEDHLVFFSKCHESPWVLVRRTDPRPVLNYAHPVVQALTQGRKERNPAIDDDFLIGRIPTLYPRPRPFGYVEASPMRRLAFVLLSTCGTQAPKRQAASA